MKEEEKGSCFRDGQWMAVLNTEKCEHSVTQLEALKKIKKDHGVQMSAIDCSDAGNFSLPICTDVANFPAICDSENNRCVYGVRRTLEELESVCLSIKRESRTPS